MSQNQERSAGSESPLPERMLRVHLAAPAGQPTVQLEASQPVTLIGGRQDCDLSIRQGDVSKVHCALVNTGRAIIATDLCSRAGTFVNGRRISIATLSPGDELRVGQVRVALQFLDDLERAPWATVGQADLEFALPVPLRLNGAERQHELTALPAVIGRRHTCRIVLDTPDVSLAHALLLAIDDCPAIFDLGSRSGTYVNAERVTLAWLHAGDRLGIGGEELTLAWEGPEWSRGPANSVTAAKGADTQQPSSSAQPPGLADLSSLVKLPNSAADDEQIAFALEQQRLEQQAAQLQATSLRIEQDRAQIDELRAQSERERAQLGRQRAEFEQRLAKHQTSINELKRREAEFNRREATLVRAERVVAESQAQLAEREAACLEAARRIEQFKEALTGARCILGSIEATTQQAAASARRSAAVGNPALESNGDAPPLSTDRASADVVLPAPLVDRPLFDSLENGARQ